MHDQDIAFVRTKLPRPFMDVAARRRLFSHTTQCLLETVFDHGGYVAGGFGTIVARRLLGSVDDQAHERLVRDVRSHLGMPKRPLTAAPGSPHAWRHNAGTGDIDVWFPDEPALGSFLRDPRRLRLIEHRAMYVSPTVTGTAIEHIVEGDARVQVIVRFLMPIEEQLARFDIYNGMVAVTHDEVVVPEHWSSLEKARMLHVSTWKCPWTVNRFFKWMNRKGYTAVTPSSAEAIVSQGLAALDWFKLHEHDVTDPRVSTELEKSTLLKKMAANPDNRQAFLRTIVEALPADRLLEVSAFFRPAKYDLAMQELMRRMPVK